MKTLIRLLSNQARIKTFVWVICFSFTYLLLPQHIEAQISYGGKVDIAELMKKASQNFDLDKEDAVILYDSEEQLWLRDSRLYTEVHRIVWIGKSWAIGHFADHRVPYDQSRQTFTVNALRTWRDEQWWVSDTTAVVETLPGAVSSAYDYTNIREMMLLHDGVELPCILEWAYTIEDKESFRKGSDGIWIFEKDLPVVESTFSFGISSGSKTHVFASNEVGGVQVKSKISPPDPPGSGKSEPPGNWRIQAPTELDIYTYRMELIPALPTPHTADPAAYSPHIEWSTWKDWDKLGQNFRKTFESALELDNSLRDSLDVLLADAFSMNDKAKRIADFVGRSTRYVNYPAHFWYTDPRPAHRSFSTAYCHQLDRAVLAAALFKEAGFEIFPTFRGLGFHDVNNGVPTTGRFGEVGVWVSGSEEVEALYNPDESNLQNGLAPIYGRSVWIPGSGDDPKVTWRGEANRSTVELNLNLSFDEENKIISGCGFYLATQGLCPFDKMEGLGGEAREFLGSVLAGVIKNADISTYSPTSFSRFTVALGFEFTAPFDEEPASVWEQSNRRVLNIGEPAGGIFDRLPEDISIFRETRSSDVRLPGLMEQVVNISLDYGDMEISYVPESQDISNDMGSFKLSVEHKDSRIRIKRTLTFEKVDCPAEKWEELRLLLLADRNERNRILVFE